MTMDYKKQLLDADAARKEADAARELVSKVIERVNDGFVALNSDWRYTYVNERAARLLQRENPDELIGKHIWTEYPEGVGQPFYHAYLRAQETQQVITFEEYYPPWDQWFENRIYPSVDGLTIYFTEITARKKAEQSIIRINRALMVLSDCNEALIRTTNEEELLNKVCDIITEVGQYPLVWIGFNKNDKFKSVKSVAHRGFDDGYLDEITISWGDKEQGADPTGKAICTGQPVIIQDLLHYKEDTWLQHTAQKYAVAAVIALPIKTSKITYGALNIYAEGVNAFDEEETHLLQELADDLAFGIATLRAQIEREQLQRQLQQAQKMEAIGQLTGGIAHDFNNILGCIMGYTSLALDRYGGNSDTKLTDYLNEVYKAGERARDLIAQMLAFSRSSVSNNAQPLAPGPLVKEAVKLLQSTLPSSIHLHTEIDINVSNVKIDPVHMHQLVMNLCINARDAMDGEGQIDVLISQVSGVEAECDSCHEHVKGDFVELAVRDTGSGLDASVIERIFDPFFTTKKIGKGTGMGLSIVHGIVHEHEGHILLENASGGGCVFRLLFPAVTEQVEVTETKATGISRDLSRANEGQLMVVDDDESMATLLTDMLCFAGYQVTKCINSVQALSLFKKNPQSFDLVITDQTMPGITGVELAKKMLHLRSDIPIILCTGYSEKIDNQTAEKLGVKQYLQKPVRADVLLESVAKILNDREQN